MASRSTGWQLRLCLPFLNAPVLILLSIFPALAASSDCLIDGAVDQTVRIQACTRMIDDATESARNRIIAYFKLGSVWAERRDYDRAIADFGAMIDLDPTEANGYRVAVKDCPKGFAEYRTAIVTP